MTGTLLHAIWAVNANDVFAVGDGGTILRRQNGNAWTQMTSGTTANLRGLWASSSTDVWAGGVGGVILHYDGTAWSPVTGATSDVDAVWGSGSNDVWFCGSGTVLRRANNAFTKFSFAGTLLAVSGTGPSDVWVTGENTN
ncbi:MAG: WD40 repeat domain-containing protein, partial [Kofleriaceae bacterium]